MIDDKKEQILTAAMKIFAEKGFHSTKIYQIADLAGVASGTVYLYFEKKEKILEEILFRAWLRVVDKLFTLNSDKSISATNILNEFVKDMFCLIDDKREIAKMVLHEHYFQNTQNNSRLNEMVTKARNILEDVLKRGINSGEFKITDASLATSFIVGGLWSLLAYCSENLVAVDEAKLIDQTQKMIINGLQ